jgi:hypothetical protein
MVRKGFLLPVGRCRCGFSRGGGGHEEVRRVGGRMRVGRVLVILLLLLLSCGLLFCLSAPLLILSLCFLILLVGIVRLRSLCVLITTLMKIIAKRIALIDCVRRMLIRMMWLLLLLLLLLIGVMHALQLRVGLLPTRLVCTHLSRVLGGEGWSHH